MAGDRRLPALGLQEWLTVWVVGEGHRAESETRTGRGALLVSLGGRGLKSEKWHRQWVSRSIKTGEKAKTAPNPWGISRNRITQASHMPLTGNTVKNNTHAKPGAWVVKGGRGVRGKKKVINMHGDLKITHNFAKKEKRWGNAIRSGAREGGGTRQALRRAKKERSGDSVSGIGGGRGKGAPFTK